MNKKLHKKIAAIMLILALLLAGCTGGETPASTPTDDKSDSNLSTETTQPETKSEGSSAPAQVVAFNTVDSESWDPLRDSTAASWTHHVLEGLMCWEDGQLALGTAESIDISDDGLVYSIKIRDNAKWSDGTDVTAEQYRYGMMRILDPDNACKYAKESYYIKNGLAYNSGEATAEDVGIKVVDDKTLEITLEAPCAYFKELLTNKRYAPIRQEIVEGDVNWWQDPAKFVGNGPFMVETMNPTDKVVLRPNPYYHSKDRVKLEELEIKFITDSQVELMAFKNNEIQVGIIPAPEAIDSLKESNELVVTPKLSIYYLVVNTQKDEVSDAKVRQALSMAINRQQIVDNVTKGQEVPAYGLCPDIVMDYGKNMPFRDVYPEYFTENIEKAKELLKEAGYPDGKGFPKTVYAISSGGEHAKIAQAIQAMWKANLGIEVEIESLETSVFIKERKNGTYPIARYQWSSSYSDPIAWLGLYLSTDENNDSKYVNTAYDELILSAMTEVNVEKRFEMLHEAEEMIINDMAVIPLFYPTNKFYVKNNVKGVGFNADGSLQFKLAYVE